MPNKKASTVARCLEAYIVHVRILDIIQYDNSKEFKKAALILLKNYGIKVINGRPQTLCMQGLVEQANGVMKDKLKKHIKVTENLHWTQHLLQVALAMNIQGHNSLSYNMSPYEILFGRKYCHCPNSIAIIHEQQQLNIDSISDEIIDTSCEQNSINPTLADVLQIYLEYELDNNIDQIDEEDKNRIDALDKYYWILIF